MTNLQTYKDAFPNWAIISLETTGLKPGVNEILKITVVDHYGKMVLEELYKPYRTQKWSDAEKLNGISFRMVQNKPHIHEKANEISNILKKYDFLVTNNAKFCMGFLDAVNISYSIILGIGDLYQQSMNQIFGRPYHRINTSMINILQSFEEKKRIETHSKTDNIRYIYLRLSISMDKILASLDDTITEPTTGRLYRPFLTEEQRLQYLMEVGVQDYADTKIKALRHCGKSADLVGIICDSPTEPVKPTATIYQELMIYSDNKFQTVIASQFIQENIGNAWLPFDDLMEEPEDFGVL